jgi:hypothetical protein
MEVVGEKYDLFDAVGRDSFIYEATYICSVEEHRTVTFLVYTCLDPLPDFCFGGRKG